jgi:uncharacterized membrane protein
MQNTRPLLQSELQRPDKITEIIAYGALIALWIFIIAIYNRLPDTVPTHFDGSGNADGYGDRASVVIGPMVCTVLFMVLSILQRKPHWFNYTTDITPENALRQYTVAVKMLRMLKLSIVVIFGLIEFHTYKSAVGLDIVPGEYLILAVLALVYIPVFYFLIQSSKNT